MAIYLPEDLRQFVHDAVRAGRYANEGDVIRDALIRLKQTMPEDIETPGKENERARPDQPKEPLTRAEFDRHLLAIGLLSQLPESDADFDDPDDQPIAIEGEPLSETVIRERR